MLSFQTQEKIQFVTPPIVVKYFILLIRRMQFLRAKRKLRSASQLHLGCGGNLLTGWHNIDLGRSKGVILLDLSRPLPVRSNSIRFIFSEHFLEHLTLPEGRQFIAECYRVLAPGGILRISTPSLEFGLRAYADKNITAMSYRGWHPQSPCQMLNEGMRLWGHQFVYDNDELAALLKQAGFTNIQTAQWHKSRHPELCELECRPFHDDLIFEAEKPLTPSATG